MEAEDIVNTLLIKNLVIRCDRVWKTVRPGKKKLSSWPAHLEIHQEQVFTEMMVLCLDVSQKTDLVADDSFIYLACLCIGGLLISSLPIPMQDCGTVLLRWSLTVYLIPAFIKSCHLWRIMGSSWKTGVVLPQYNAEETTFRELVRFGLRRMRESDQSGRQDFFYATVALLVILLLRHHAPDEAARARYQKKVSNIIDDVLEWSPKLALSGMMDKHTEDNATETSNYTSHATMTTEKIHRCRRGCGCR
ncbi:Translocation protein SEC62 [Hordeum vulgare]|nr:Translocation protein SEC62 [Hordeum vulgare]